MPRPYAVPHLSVGGHPLPTEVLPPAVEPGLRLGHTGLCWLSPVPAHHEPWWQAHQADTALQFGEVRPPLHLLKAEAPPKAKGTGQMLPTTLALPSGQRGSTGSAQEVITSLSKAFFCGALPEVLLVHVWPGDEAPLVQAIVKLLAMQNSTGYWLATGRHAGDLAMQMEQCLPKVLLVGQGMVYSSFCNRLLWQVQQLELASAVPRAEFNALLLAHMIRVMAPTLGDEASGGVPKPVHLLGTHTQPCRSVQSHFHTLCWPSKVKVQPKAVLVQAEWHHWLAYLTPALTSGQLALQGQQVTEAMALVAAVAQHHGWPLPTQALPVPNVEASVVEAGWQAKAHQRTLAMLADYASKQGFWPA